MRFEETLDLVSQNMILLSPSTPSEREHQQRNIQISSLKASMKDLISLWTY